LDALENTGVPRDHISLAGRDADGAPKALDDDKGKKVGAGAATGAAVGIAAGVAASFIPGIGPVLAIGPLSGLLAGAGLGAAAGGVVGALVGWGIPEAEAHHYAEGIRRGGVLVTAQVEDALHGRAEAAMETLRPLDLDTLATGWRSSGWTGFDAGSEAYDDERLATERDTWLGHSEIEEGRIPIVEEELKVGKRSVETGHARVRSFIIETPVAQDIELSTERVRVERVAVDRPLRAGESLLREETIEVTAYSEEPVIEKEARVVEEVVVTKELSSRTEHVADTVRRTDVRVEDESQRAPQGR
jgi:uncharacterized protein (TIGR02271 family)